MSEPQVIRWTIYNPAAPNVQCSVLRRHDDRCPNQAEWAIVSDFDGSNYRMTAYCAEHWAMRAIPIYPSEPADGRGQA